MEGCVFLCNNSIGERLQDSTVWQLYGNLDTCWSLDVWGRSFGLWPLTTVADIHCKWNRLVFGSRSCCFHKNRCSSKGIVIISVMWTPRVQCMSVSEPHFYEIPTFWWTCMLSIHSVYLPSNINMYIHIQSRLSFFCQYALQSHQHKRCQLILTLAIKMQKSAISFADNFASRAHKNRRRFSNLNLIWRTSSSQSSWTWWEIFQINLVHLFVDSSQDLTKRVKGIPFPAPAEKLYSS